MQMMQQNRVIEHLYNRTNSRSLLLSMHIREWYIPIPTFFYCYYSKLSLLFSCHNLLKNGLTFHPFPFEVLMEEGFYKMSLIMKSEEHFYFQRNTPLDGGTNSLQCKFLHRRRVWEDLPPSKGSHAPFLGRC